MWHITQATTNYVYPTCAEKQLLTSPSYIIKFIQDTGKNLKYCCGTDSSTYPDRNQKLTVVETTTPTDVTNQVSLKLGSWKAYVYEISAADLSNVVSLALVDYTALTLVHEERVEVSTTANTFASYTGGQTTLVQYGN